MPAKKSREDEIMLLCIIAVGTALRLAYFPHNPFMYDELSTVNRVFFNSFSELIERGVKIDIHPAGMQVFTYYWAKLFGTSELSIKLPHILMGIACIPLSYVLARKWFGATTALLVATCMATLQYPVTYSNIARLYISGLFFSLIMTLCWSNFFFSEKRRLLNAAGFAIAAALCAYNHYFSMFFAGVVGATGFFLFNKRNWKLYLLACSFALLLYLPHIPVFITQLNVGGVEWLGKPKSDFLWQYIQYLFNYSPLVLASVLILFITGIVMGKDELLAKTKFRLICIAWFLLPFIVGYCYSIFGKPILQFSGLIFSFPFFLIFLFSFYRNTSLPFKIISTTLLLLVNTLTLIFAREHYKVFDKQPVEQFALHAIEVQEDENTAIILNTDSNYLNYYFRKYNSKPKYYNFYHKHQSLVEFRKFVSALPAQTLITGGITLEQLNIATEYFPYEQYRQDGYSYVLYRLSKTPGAEKFPGGVLFESTYSKNNPDWTFPEQQDDSIVVITTTSDFGPTFSAKLHDNATDQHQIIDISLSFFADTINIEGNIVFEYTKGKETLDWRAYPISSYFDSDSLNQWQTAYMPVRMTDIVSTCSEMHNTQTKIYFWNNGHRRILLKDFKVRVRKDNDWIYGLFERLK